MRLDLHIHSSHSRDAKPSPRDVVLRCKAIGLDGFAVTDHNAIEGSLTAASLAAEHGLLAVRAVEVSTAEGHVLAYGVDEVLPRGLPITETIESIHAAGGLAVAAHPVRFPSGIGLHATRLNRFDAVEVLNGGSSRRNNAKARRVAEEMHLPVTAGSDAHELQEIGKCYVESPSVSSEDELLETMRTGVLRAGGRSRTRKEGVVYSVETLVEWVRGSFRRL
ncbi:MAG: CehA/McbA family metallohydrolase [Thermoplasmata archaeon]